MTLSSCFLSLEARVGATEEDIKQAEMMLGQPLPADLRTVLQESNGLEGFVSETSYIILWSTSELPSLNDAYAVSEFAPGVTLIGTDGGDTAYGFWKSSGQVEYLSVPLVGLSLEATTVLGKTFWAILDSLDVLG